MSSLGREAPLTRDQLVDVLVHTADAGEQPVAAYDGWRGDYIRAARVLNVHLWADAIDRGFPDCREGAVID
jgi:hypothetical protein